MSLFLGLFIRASSLELEFLIFLVWQSTRCMHSFGQKNSLMIVSQTAEFSAESLQN
jgi:hypothetical protein